MADENEAVIRNCHVVHLSEQQDLRTAVADRSDLNVAIECIENLELFGIVESFESSVDHIKK